MWCVECSGLASSVDGRAPGTNFPSFSASIKHGWCGILLAGTNSPSPFGIG